MAAAAWAAARSWAVGYRQPAALAAGASAQDARASTPELVNSADCAVYRRRARGLYRTRNARASSGTLASRTSSCDGAQPRLANLAHEEARGLAELAAIGVK